MIYIYFCRIFVLGKTKEDMRFGREHLRLIISFVDFAFFKDTIIDFVSSLALLFGDVAELYCGCVCEAS